MRRFCVFLCAALVATCIGLGPSAADARVNSGLSLGSRGSRTYVAPPGTASSPYGASPSSAA